MPEKFYLSKADSPMIDITIRMQSSASGTKLLIKPTTAIMNTFNNAFKYMNMELNNLVEVIHYQKSIIDYNEHYNTFLTGQITEDEFEKISDEFTYDQREIKAEEIVDKIKTVIFRTKLEYTTSDFSALFKCPIETVIEAERLIFDGYKIKEEIDDYGY